METGTCPRVGSSIKSSTKQTGVTSTNPRQVCVKSDTCVQMTPGEGTHALLTRYDTLAERSNIL